MRCDATYNRGIAKVFRQELRIWITRSHGDVANVWSYSLVSGRGGAKDWCWRLSWTDLLCACEVANRRVSSRFFRRREWRGCLENQDPWCVEPKLSKGSLQEEGGIPLSSDGPSLLLPLIDKARGGLIASFAPSTRCVTLRSPSCRPFLKISQFTTHLSSQLNSLLIFQQLWLPSRHPREGNQCPQFLIMDKFKGIAKKGWHPDAVSKRHIVTMYPSYVPKSFLRPPCRRK